MPLQQPFLACFQQEPINMPYKTQQLSDTMIQLKDHARLHKRELRGTEEGSRMCSLSISSTATAATLFITYLQYTKAYLRIGY